MRDTAFEEWERDFGGGRGDTDCCRQGHGDADANGGAVNCGDGRFGAAVDGEGAETASVSV